VTSTPPLLELTEAAQRLGVHYQTAYRWIRSGQLPATLVDGRYRIEPTAVEQLSSRRSAPRAPRARRPRQGFPALADRARGELVQGDERSVRLLVEDLLGHGVGLTTVIERVLAPAMGEVGLQWSTGHLDIAAEHRASAIVERLLAEHFPRPRGRRRGTVAVAALSGDRHALPVTMAAIALAEDRWHVQLLGADLPAEELERFVDRQPVDLAVISVTEPSVGQLACRTEQALLSAGVPVLVGGPGRSLAELQQLARDARRAQRAAVAAG
jgi:excisionase family DNA binding protein